MYTYKRLYITVLTVIISKLWDLNTCHLLLLDLLTYLQWAHFPVIKTWGEKPPVAPHLLRSSHPHDRAPALLTLFHTLPYPLCSEHHKRWFQHTVAGYHGAPARATSPASWEASTPLKTAQGHFLLACPPPTLSASSISSFWSSLISSSDLCCCTCLLIICELLGDQNCAFDFVFTALSRELGSLGSCWSFREAGSLDAQKWSWKSRWQTYPDSFIPPHPAAPCNMLCKNSKIFYILLKMY